MCGFAGFWSPRMSNADELRAGARRMAESITHRGPDDRGEWAEPGAGVALGFRRLSIIDLSEFGHQPMRSRSGRFTMVFNGEVYNFGELRRELESCGASFRGHSDTEVMLAAFEQWGVEASVRRFVGMFALAVWDADARALSLVRDRLGIKPLFYYHEHGYLSFGSELKALAAGPRFSHEIDRDALAAFLRHLYVPAPHCIWRGARKLMPGHVLTVREPAAVLPEPVPFWSLCSVAQAGLAEPFQGPDSEAIDTLERLLKDAVALRMIADVPLGALLSGGVDSSVVVALMQSVSTRPVKTYTIAFDDPAHDEAVHAARVAQHLHTEHTQLLVTGREALDVVPRLAEMFDEPHADPSSVPTHLVSALARREVTVALTGDGGDELFAGYNRYVHGTRLLGRLTRVPAPVRRLVAAGISGISPANWDRVVAALAPLVPRHVPLRLAGEKAYKTGRLLEAGSAEAMYRSLVSAWQVPTALVAGATEPPDAIGDAFTLGASSSLLDRMMLADQLAYLPDDLLAKVDRASMAVSLEARVPVLDHRVVEFSWRLPERFRIRDGRGKWLLRQVLYRHVPSDLVDRPKVGFTVPVEGWLRGPLRAWGEDLLRARGQGRELLDMGAVNSAWDNLQRGREPAGLSVWAALTFLAWSARWAA